MSTEKPPSSRHEALLGLAVILVSLFGVIGLNLALAYRAVGADHDTVKLLLSLGLALILVLPFHRRLVPVLLAWAWARPLLFGVIGLVLAVVYRAVGADYGLPDLFWHENSLVQFWAGFSVALLFGLIVGLFLATEPVLAVPEPAQPAATPREESGTEQIAKLAEAFRQAARDMGAGTPGIRGVERADAMEPDRERVLDRPVQGCPCPRGRGGSALRQHGWPSGSRTGAVGTAEDAHRMGPPATPHRGAVGHGGWPRDAKRSPCRAHAGCAGGTPRDRARGEPPRHAVRIGGRSG